MQVKGMLHKIFDLTIYSEKFKKIEFVVKDESAYPQYLKFEFDNDHCNKLDNFKVGDKVIINFDLRGKAWRNPETNKEIYINSLVAWKIEKEGTAETQATRAVEADMFGNEKEINDLPF